MELIITPRRATGFAERKINNVQVNYLHAKESTKEGGI